MSENTNIFLIKAFLITSIVNHHHATRDENPFALSNLNTELFAQDPEYYRARHRSRILLYKEMHESLYRNQADFEFLHLVGLFCQTFDTLETAAPSSTYANCIEVFCFVSMTVVGFSDFVDADWVAELDFLQDQRFVVIMIWNFWPLGIESCKHIFIIMTGIVIIIVFF